MILPPYKDIQTDRGTYYTFNTSNTALTRRITTRNEDSHFYMTHFIAVELPPWTGTNFKFRLKTSNPPGDIEHYHADSGGFPELDDVNEDYLNPNKVIPRLMTYYFENLCRTKAPDNAVTDVGSYSKLWVSFLWKLLRVMGIPEDMVVLKNNTVKIEDTIYRYVGKFITQSFINFDPNNGWQEIIAEIPNDVGLLKSSGLFSMYEKRQSFNAKWVDDVKYLGNCIFDKADFSFDINPCYIDFDKMKDDMYDKSEEKEMSFNALLTFFQDHTRAYVPHGIYFPSAYRKNSIGVWELPKYTFTTNITNSFGYNFKFNTRINASKEIQTMIYSNQEGGFYNTFSETLTTMNDFLVKTINRVK